MKQLNEATKRGLDMAVSVLLLLATLPLLLLLVILIRCTSDGPAIFRQKRVGKDGRIFTILKLRTMVQNAPDIRNADGSTYNAASDPRVTRIGKLLRKTSCDELPQLVNVLCGDMSLVGPRPELPGGQASYTESQVARLRVRPGMTGLAVVSGRNDLCMKARRDMDAWYADNWTLAMDVEIIWRTFSVVLPGQGVNAGANPMSASEKDSSKT